MVGFDLGHVTAGKADDQIARLGFATFQCRNKGIAADRVINHVDTAQSFDTGHDIFFGAIYGDGRASIFANLQFFRPAGHGDDRRA